MAKSWKSFVKKEESQEEPEENSLEIKEIEQELNFSIADLAKTNKDLELILKERNELEAKMQDLLQPGAKKEEVDPRFSSEVQPLNEKRAQDKKNFDIKRKLEEKIKVKNKEFEAWKQKGIN